MEHMGNDIEIHLGYGMLVLQIDSPPMGL
jgi:hypothetical protein